MVFSFAPWISFCSALVLSYTWSLSVHSFYRKMRTFARATKWSQTQSSFPVRLHPCPLVPALAWFLGAEVYVVRWLCSGVSCFLRKRNTTCPSPFPPDLGKGELWLHRLGQDGLQWSPVIWVPYLPYFLGVSYSTHHRIKAPSVSCVCWQFLPELSLWL